MNYKTLELKPIIDLPCNFDEEAERTGKVRCKDLLAAPLNEEIEIKESMETVIVNKYYVARPDLISLAVYGTDSYGDFICKFNGISNPFELNEDMILYVPSRNDINNIFSKSGEGACELLESDSSIKKKVSKYTKKKTDARSPSMAVVGDTNYIIDKTNCLVFY